MLRTLVAVRETEIYYLGKRPAGAVQLLSGVVGAGVSHGIGSNLAELVIGGRPTWEFMVGGQGLTGTWTRASISRSMILYCAGRANAFKRLQGGWKFLNCPPDGNTPEEPAHLAI